MCLAVILPKLFLPPDFFKETVNDFSGTALVISSKVKLLLNLVPGVVGFNF